MSNRNETFGRLLKGAINSIAAYEGKAAPSIEEELGGQIGLTGAAIQRYKAGFLPPEPRTVAALAEAGVRRGFLARAWLSRFLQAARYPNPEALLTQLADAFGTSAPAVHTGLPTGTVALLFTDIAASTQRWEQQPRLMERALERHDEILRQAIDAYGGQVFKTVGDAVYAVFTTVPAALEAAISAQTSLHAERWGPIGPLSVRMAIHLGAPLARDGDYFGPPLNRVARILSAGNGGQVLLSLSAQELVYDALPSGVSLRNLGEHRLKDLGRPERIFQLVAPGLPADFPPLRSLESYRHNLPSQATPLIGREVEIEQVCALLDQPETHLVTLTGPGGVGKTRLALQVATELLEGYADGVTFVALAALRDPAQVPEAVALALGLRETPALPLAEQLRQALRPRQALLVLDNVEQVVAAAPWVGELLATAPHVKVLATSREPLRIYGEQEFSVSPLALPEPGRLLPLERLTQVEALRLFIERARSVRPDLVVTAENAPIIAEICARLDGLPLAIELAAARSKLFPPRALLARLDQRLRTLVGGPRDLPARQQTLAGAIAWSYDLLDASEQTVFARLGVFAGGCTLEAAEAVVGDDQTADDLAAYVPVDAVERGVAVLLDRSLLRQVEGEDGELRLVMLETIREFALERLAASGEEALIRTRHARWVRGLVEQAERHLRGAAQLGWYHRLDGERSNVHAALAWSFGEGDAALGVAIAAASWWHWLNRDQIRVGYTWVEQALASGAGDERARAGALTGSGLLTMFHPEAVFTSGIAPSTNALAIWRALGEPWWEAYCLAALGLFELFGTQNTARARELFDAAASVAQGTGESWICCYTELGLGLYFQAQGDRAQAQAHYEAGLIAGRASGDRLGVIEPLRALARDTDATLEQRIAWAEEALAAARALASPLSAQRLLVVLANLYGAAGRLRDAVEAYDESATLGREQGASGHTHEYLLGRGWVALLGGKLEEAHEWYRKGLTSAVADQCREHQWFGLVGLAQVAVQQGRHREAATRFAAAAQLRNLSLGVDLPEQIGHEEALATTRAALGEEVWVKVWAEGQALSPQQVLACMEAADSEEPKGSAD